MKKVYYALVTDSGMFRTHSTSRAMPALYKTINIAKQYGKGFNVVEVTIDTENVITDAEPNSAEKS